MNAPAFPPAFVGARTEPPRVIVRPELPLCVRVSEERGEDLGRHAQFWHDVHERESLGGCGRCAYLAAAPYRQPDGHAIDPGTYADDAGRALVAKGLWSPDQLLTERQDAAAREQRRQGGR